MSDIIKIRLNVNQQIFEKYFQDFSKKLFKYELFKFSKINNCFNKLHFQVTLIEAVTKNEL